MAPTRIREVAVQVAQATNGKKAPRRRRRPRARRPNNKGKPTNLVGPNKYLVERTTSRGGRSQIGRWVNSLTHLSDHAYEFIHRHCNPCGEMMTFTESSKVPDAALPNSCILELRQVAIVRAPGEVNTAIDITGDMWTLTVIHTAMFRNSIILVASLINAEMDDNARAALITAWNTQENQPEYPNWYQLEADNSTPPKGTTFYCVLKWSGLADVDAPTTTGIATSIEEFRITADGMTIFNNTPDLINQGMVVGAQWNSDFAVSTVKGDVQEDGTHITVLVSRESLPALSGGVAARFPIDPDTLLVTTIGAISSDQYRVDIQGSDLSAYRYFVAYIAITSATDTGINVSAEITYSMIVDGVTLPAGTRMNVQLISNGTSAPAAWVNFGDFATPDPIIKDNDPSSAATFREEVSVVLLDGTIEQLVTQWRIPPTTTQSIIQSTPKAVYMSMKEENGVYMVKRIFQPIFNVQKAAEVRTIHMADPVIPSRLFPLGPLDVFDANYGVGVVVMASIPKACAPALKLIRDVEVVATERSTIQLFMKSNAGSCQTGVEIVKTLAEQHPFMYPESYNTLGSLMDLISGAVRKVPVLGNVVSILRPIISSLTGRSTQSGSSQNRLQSTNHVEMAKNLSELMSQLGLGT